MSTGLSTHAAFVTALAGAQRIDVESYVLPPEIAGDLCAAAARGAAVHVRLAAHLVGNAAGARAAGNARTVAALRASGADAELVDPASGSLHAKAALVDDVLWLDDRNFPRVGPDLVLRDDDPRDVAAARAWLAGGPVPASSLVFDKRSALALEAAAIATAPPGEIDLSSELVGTGSVVNALVARACEGDRVRVIVDQAECTSPSARTALHELREAGAEVRSRRVLDKLCVDEDTVWLGSANASHPDSHTAGQSDWGYVAHDAPTVATAQAAFEGAWASANATLA